MKKKGIKRLWTRCQAPMARVVSSPAVEQKPEHRRIITVVGPMPCVPVEPGAVPVDVRPYATDKAVARMEEHADKRQRERLHIATAEKLPWVKWSELPKTGRLMKPAKHWKAKIYALVDPVDDGIRYVGVTSQPLQTRMVQHLLNPTNARMRVWVARLAAENRDPHIRLISMAQSDDWQGAELNWIAWVRVRGPLLNVDPGGKFRDKKGQVLPHMREIARTYEEAALRELHERQHIAGRMNTPRVAGGRLSGLASQPSRGGRNRSSME